MSTTDLITIISLVLSVLSLGISGVALYGQIKDRAQLIIKDIRPGICGHMEAEQWKHEISSIEVQLKNKGSRPALQCQGVATFFKLDGLPLYPVNRNHEVIRNTNIFDVPPGETITLVAQIPFHNPGRYLPAGDFIRDGLPVTITITHAGKRLSSSLTKIQGQQIIDQHRANAYLGYPIQG